MKGTYFYFAAAALLAVLSIIVDFLPFLLLMGVYLFCLYKYKRWKKQQLFILVLSSLVFMGSALHIVNKNHSVIPDTTIAFVLEFTQDPLIDGDLLQIQAKDLRYQEKIIARYKIKTEQEQENLQNRSFYKVNCYATGTLKKPSIAKNPNSFDYQKYLASKNIYWIIELDKNPIQNCTSVTSNPLIKLKQFRFNGIRYLDTHFPNEIAALSSALIYGDRNLFDPNIIENYQETGLVHLLAISGLHVSLLTGMVFFMGIRVGITRQFMTNFLVTVLPIYAVLTGASPSVNRSVLMISMVLLSSKGKHQLTALDAISLTFMAYLIFQPFIIIDVGFQLTFSVSFAIILSSHQILKENNGHVPQMIKVSVVSQLAAMPCLLYHFFELSLIGIITNMIYIPLFSFIYLPLSYLLLIIEIIFGKNPELFIQLYRQLIHAADNLLQYLGNGSLTVFTPGRPPLVVLIAYIFLIMLIFFHWEKKRNTQRLIGMFCILFTFQFGYNWLNVYGEVTMIDVGQGDSLLIHMPHGKGNYLIDTGGTVMYEGESWKQKRKPFEVGRDVVVPLLKSKGITTINKLILTHGDMDHIGGALSVIKELHVKEILLPDVAQSSETELDIIKEAEKRKIPVIRVSEGFQWSGGSATFTILGPKENFNGERNSGSIATFAQVGGLNWFFGGDLDQEGEQRIIQKYPNLKVDVLKAGHHGSKTSSSNEFIKRISPAIALISVGEHNHFGHPHQEVLNKLNEAGATIYRTDQQGAVTYQFYRQSGTFSLYLP
ncbi:DNA internalization-related competence protein ComEC/Rec2 [Neobacillus dielmonensis]|uniref:DNA internalization-related competence protein ComEC/Rec2 n=1 Tax=Neobacillus dielmonensis TaxID=1347369 RepID=UPI0005A9DA9F|nr:DNA internalization-related competence protein ComEC/Rec2 [Neobacillus dielmonensis]